MAPKSIRLAGNSPGLKCYEVKGNQQLKRYLQNTLLNTVLADQPSCWRSQEFGISDALVSRYLGRASRFRQKNPAMKVVLLGSHLYSLMLGVKLDTTTHAEG